MAHSIQILNDKHEIFNDLDLMVIVAFAREEFATRTHDYSELAPLIPKWEHEIKTCGPGTIDLRLKEIEGSPLARSQLPDLKYKVTK